MVWPIVLALLTPMLSMGSEGELLTSDVRSDSRSGRVERGRGAAAFHFGAIFFLNCMCVGPHLPQGPVMTENHVCVCVLIGCLC